MKHAKPAPAFSTHTNYSTASSMKVRGQREHMCIISRHHFIANQRAVPYLGNRWTRPGPNLLKATVTRMFLSSVWAGSAPSSIVCKPDQCARFQKQATILPGSNPAGKVMSTTQALACYAQTAQNVASEGFITLSCFSRKQLEIVTIVDPRVTSMSPSVALAK